MGSGTPKLIVQYLPDETNQARTAEFEALWKPLIDREVGDRLNVSTLHNYGGGRAYRTNSEEDRVGLLFPWTSMSVLWDGRVVTCCMDSNGVQVLGDLRTQTVQEVWNGPVLTGLRDSFRRLRLRQVCGFSTPATGCAAASRGAARGPGSSGEVLQYLGAATERLGRAVRGPGRCWSCGFWLGSAVFGAARGLRPSRDRPRGGSAGTMIIVDRRGHGVSGIA